ncbi:MAG: glycosyltransferase, partial [Clostridia bacterium]|nr:glycosyltransferase [Clostridia bacterium]
DKPLIAILMAVYEPRMDWLREQLNSLDQQTYPNLRLYVRDDASPTVSFDDISSLIQSCIHRFPVEIHRNEQNLGSNRTFERLTLEAEGEYFAYCDQDDIWLPEKLTVLQKAIEETKAELVCSDMYIIDGEGKQVADSITKVRRHHVFRSGNGLASQMLISNFAAGCTVLIRADTAREAAPFCPSMVHDHYLTLFSATRGRVHSLPEPLIRYRVHLDNQTLVMAGVNDKQSYARIRIDQLVDRLTWLERRFADLPELHQEITEALAWAKARQALFHHTPGAAGTVLRYRRFNPQVSLFELVGSFLPEPLFMLLINGVKKNVL